MVEDEFVGFASSYKIDLGNQADVQVSYSAIFESLFLGTYHDCHLVFLKKGGQPKERNRSDKLVHKEQGPDDGAEA